MSKTLDERLRDAKGALDLVHAALGRHPGRLPTEVSGAVRTVIDYRDEIVHWLGMMESRSAALRLLDALETKVDQDDCVSLANFKVTYQHVRLIGVQAYLTTNWALSDRISELVGRVLCTPDSGRNATNLAQLVSHFVERDKVKKTTAAAIFESVRRTFGWPIGLSYAIRNHFVHGGGQLGGCEFFEGPAAGAGFRVSAEGWDRVEKQAESYAVERTFHRAGPGWPSAPRDDLRVVLNFCEREMDDALGVLLGSACSLLLAHVGFMVGED